MENNTQLTTKKDLKSLLSSNSIKTKLEQIVGKNINSFTTSIIQVANSNNMLKNAEPASIINSAIISATLNLPLNNNLGFAYIVPFKNNKTNTTEAQFQIGYKGFIQLALRSGQFKNISVTPIYEGEIISKDRLRGFEFDFENKTSEVVIGYAAMFSLINGFEKTLYMSKENIEKHAKKFSQTYKKGFGLWKDDFDSMACKTVLKLLLSKYAPMNVEMQKAQIADQAIINEVNEQGEIIDVTYTDNETDDLISPEEIEQNRIITSIEKAQSIEQLERIPLEKIQGETLDLFETKKSELIIQSK